MFIECLGDVFAVFGTRLRGFIASQIGNFKEATEFVEVEVNYCLSDNI
jgi:hypothetical protein